MKCLAQLKKSWTIWFNALSGLLAVAELHFQLLQPYIGDKFYGAAFFALLMVNAGLRIRTELKHNKALVAKEMDGKVVPTDAE